MHGVCDVEKMHYALGRTGTRWTCEWLWSPSSLLWFCRTEKPDSLVCTAMVFRKWVRITHRTWTHKGLCKSKACLHCKHAQRALQKIAGKISPLPRALIWRTLTCGDGFNLISTFMLREAKAQRCQLFATWLQSRLIEIYLPIFHSSFRSTWVIVYLKPCIFEGQEINCIFYHSMCCCIKPYSAHLQVNLF